MIGFGILVGVVALIGIAKSARLVATDGHGPVPTRTYPDRLSLR